MEKENTSHITDITETNAAEDVEYSGFNVSNSGRPASLIIIVFKLKDNNYNNTAVPKQFFKNVAVVLQ